MSIKPCIFLFKSAEGKALMCDLLTDSSINKIGFQFFFSLILKKENVDGELLSQNLKL